MMTTNVGGHSSSTAGRSAPRIGLAVLTADELTVVAGGWAPWAPGTSRRDFPPQGDQPPVPQPLPPAPQVPPGSYVP
jgi:hypothetical protein